MNIRGTLQNISLFKSMEDHQFDEVISMGETRAMPADHTVFFEGDDPDGLYVILKGMVRISCRDTDGEPLELATLKTGEFFGEMALLDVMPRSATVTCLQPSRFFILTQESFLSFLMKSKGLLMTLLAGLSQRIRETNGQVVDVLVRKRRLQQEMEIERLKALTQMVTGIAHEINTPLGIANTAASLIQSLLRSTPALENSEHASMFEDIREASTLLTANIERAHKLIKSFKKLSAGQLTDTPEEIDLPELMDEIIRLFSPKAKQAKLQILFHNDLPHDMKQWYGHPGHLSTVLLNLFQNIERYAYPPGSGGKVEITLTPHSGTNAILLRIQDFGQGIAKENLSRIFDPFFTTGRSKGGTGLGLSIVKNLINDALKGNISVRSALGKGTIFDIKLP